MPRCCGAAGEGAAIEVSLFEALAEWMGFPAYYAKYGDKEPPRSGASHVSMAPYGPFACAGGRVVFLGIRNEREWERFCEAVLERPDFFSHLTRGAAAATTASAPSR